MQIDKIKRWLDARNIPCRIQGKQIIATPIVLDENDEPYSDYIDVTPFTLEDLEHWLAKGHFTNTVGDYL